MVHYIYRFWVKDELLYIGETKDMQARMYAHFCQSSKTCSLRQEQYATVTKIEYMEIPNAADGKMFEIYCINTIRAEANQKDCFADNPIPNPIYDGWQEWLVYAEGNVQEIMFRRREEEMAERDEKIRIFEFTNLPLVFFTSSVGKSNIAMKKIIDELGENFRQQHIYGCPWNQTKYITTIGQQIIQDVINKQ